MKRIGRPASEDTARATPPRAVPSSLVITTPVRPTASAKAILPQTVLPLTRVEHQQWFHLGLWSQAINDLADLAIPPSDCASSTASDRPYPRGASRFPANEQHQWHRTRPPQGLRCCWEIKQPASLPLPRLEPAARCCTEGIRGCYQRRISAADGEVGQLAEVVVLPTPMPPSTINQMLSRICRGPSSSTPGAIGASNKPRSCSLRKRMRSADPGLNVHPLPGHRAPDRWPERRHRPRSKVSRSSNTSGVRGSSPRLSEQTGHKPLAGFLQTTAESTQPIDLLQ